jgi:hypothetical protein
MDKSYELKHYVDFRKNTTRDPNQEVKVRNGRPTIVVFHCTDAEGWSPDRLARFFVDEKGWPICGYHFYVTADNIYHMVDESLVTFHAAPFNTRGVAFSIDYYATRDERLDIPVDKELLDNAIDLAAGLCIKYNIPPIKGKLVGHRELQFTGWFKKGDNIILRKTCPGMAIHLNKFRYDVCKRIQLRCNQIMPSLDLIEDGIYGPQTANGMLNVSGFEKFTVPVSGR